MPLELAKWQHRVVRLECSAVGSGPDGCCWWSLRSPQLARHPSVGAHSSTRYTHLRTRPAAQGRLLDYRGQATHVVERHLPVAQQPEQAVDARFIWHAVAYKHGCGRWLLCDETAPGRASALHMLQSKSAKKLLSQRSHERASGSTARLASCSVLWGAMGSACAKVSDGGGDVQGGKGAEAQPTRPGEDSTPATSADAGSSSSEEGKSPDGGKHKTFRERRLSVSQTRDPNAKGAA